MKRKTFRLSIVALVLLWVLALVPVSRPVHAASQPVHMGFAIGWQMPTTPPWGSLTQENLFALQTTNGTALDTSFLANVNVPAFVTDAHQHGVQALITIGGSSDQHWQDACTGTNRAGFVRNLVNYMQSNGFDGIDLDIEDDVWAAVGPPDTDMTACIEAISNAARAVKTQAGGTPLISADVITNWEGEWFAPSQSFVDQFNLMSYGDTCTPTCTTFASDVSDTVSEGLPASKFVVGIDVIDYPPPAGDCGAIASYAQQSGLMGVFAWDESTDETAGYACFHQFVGGSPTPTPTPPPPTPTPLPPTPTPSTCTP